MSVLLIGSDQFKKVLLLRILKVSIVFGWLVMMLRQMISATQPARAASIDITSSTVKPSVPDKDGLSTDTTRQKLRDKMANLHQIPAAASRVNEQKTSTIGDDQSAVTSEDTKDTSKSDVSDKDSVLEASKTEDKNNYSGTDRVILSLTVIVTVVLLALIGRRLSR